MEPTGAVAAVSPYRLNLLEKAFLDDRGKSGYLTCPNCGQRMSKQGARIQKEKDYIFVLRHAGVYCDRCSRLILDETEALQLGFEKEE